MGEEEEQAVLVQPPPIDKGIDEGIHVNEDQGPWKSVEEKNDYFTTTGENVNFLIPSSMPQSRPSEILIPSLVKKEKKPVEPVFQFSRGTTEYAIEEIRRAADKAIEGKSVDTKDSFFIAEVIEELTSRRIELISLSEYKKAQVMVNAIQRVRLLFRTADYQRFRAQYLENLIQRNEQQKLAFKELKQKIKQEVEAKQEAIKQELIKLEIKQDEERNDLVSTWQNPTKQRKFNKQSPELLRNKALEKYLALAGELEIAEDLKHKNKRMEKKEITEKFKLMEQEFKKAQDKLEIDLEQQFADAKANLEFEVIAVIESGRIKQEKAKAKLDFLAKLVKEEQSMQSKTPRINLHSTAIPILQRTGANIFQKNKMKHSNSEQNQATPLQLPPLVVKPRKRKARLSSMH